MNTYQQWKNNEELEQQGINLDFGEFKIKVARAGGKNAKFEKLLAERRKPYRRQIENGTFDKKVGEKIFAEVYAATVILGWEGVTDESGQVLPFSVENCVKVLLDLPELFAEIHEQATKTSNFRADDLEDDVKN